MIHEADSILVMFSVMGSFCPDWTRLLRIQFSVLGYGSTPRPAPVTPKSLIVGV